MAIVGGESGLMKHILRFLFKGEHALSHGFVCTNSAGERFSIHGTLGGILADEACHKVIRSIKGASGLRACGACKNIINTRRPDLISGSDFLRWHATALSSDFVRQTDQDAWSDFDAVAAAAAPGAMRKAAFENLQKGRGVTFEEGCLLGDRSLRDVYLPVSHTLYDWMHCIFASTGVAQYSLNAFLADMLQHTDLKLEDVDRFAASITFGKRDALGYLKRDFFASRYSSNPTGHIKAFAGETMSAVQVLKFFCIMVLERRGLLPHHCYCIKLLAKITGILSLGDSAVPLSTELSDLIEEHHKELLQTYGTWLCKPKAHLTYHCPDHMLQLGVNLSCFSNERRNRLLCKVVPHYRGASATSDAAPMQRLLVDLYDRIMTCSFEDYNLVEPSSDQTHELRSVFEDAPTRIKLSSAARTPTGGLSAGQFLWLRGGVDAVAKAVGFVQLTYSSDPGLPQVRAIVALYKQSVSEKSVWEDACQTAHIDLGCVAGVLPCMSTHGDKIRPLFPDYL